MLCYVCGDRTEKTSLCRHCAIKELPEVKIEREREVERCSTCLRFILPPLGWVYLEHKEKDMLSYLLKRVSELEKMKIKDAAFINSEEHSKRIELLVKIDRSEELLEHKTEHVEEVLLTWRVKGRHCLDCARNASNQTWSSVVQLRQKSSSKRTLLVVEQAVLRAGLHYDTTDIKGVPDGIDFFFRVKTPAVKLVKFIEGLLPARVKSSEELVKTDKKSNNSRYKFAYSVEIPGLNKDDLIFIPKDLSAKLSLSRLCCVLRVSRSISLIDSRGHLKEVGRVEYFKHAKDIVVVAAEKNLVPFTVVELENKHRRRVLTGKEAATLNYGRNALEDLLVLKGSGEFISTKTHLKQLAPEEKVLGYDLEHLHTDLDLELSVFIVKREVVVGGNWRICRLSGVKQNEKDLKMLVDEVSANPSLLKELNLYDENNSLIEKIKAFSIAS